MTDRGTRGEINHTYFFIFICHSVIAFSVPVLGEEPLPCSVCCDVGVNLSAAHLLFSKSLEILAFTYHYMQWWHYTNKYIYTQLT